MVTCLLSSRFACSSAVLLLVLAGAQPADGQVARADPMRFVTWAGQDVRAMARSIATRRVAAGAVGAAGLVVLLSGKDEQITQRVIDFAESAPRQARRALNEVGNVNVVRPLALLFFVGTLASGDKRLQDAAFTSVEAIILSNLMTNALKGIVGRARPYQGRGATSFAPFSGNTSFPSGHATTVFALTTPWLLHYGNIPAATLFALGAGTSIVRMADNVHWFTDVLVGTAIGFSTAYFLTRRHRRSISFLPVVRAGVAGLQLTWQI